MATAAAVCATHIKALVLLCCGVMRGRRADGRKTTPSPQPPPNPQQEPAAAEPGGVPPPPPPPPPAEERLICFPCSECGRAHFGRPPIRMSPARVAAPKHEGHPPESIIVMQRTDLSRCAPSAEQLPAVQMFDAPRRCRGRRPAAAAAAAAVHQTSDMNRNGQFCPSRITK